MRGAGIAVAVTVAALAGCGLASSGLMASAAGQTTDPDAGVTVAEEGDGAPAAAVDASSSATGDGGGGDATSGTAGGEDAAVDASGPQSSPDACSEANDGGAIYAIAAWPGPPAPMIDGDLSEWPCTNNVAFSDSNAAYVKDTAHPLSAQLQVRWDSMNVYVAAQVTDSAVGGNDTVDPSNNDSVEVYVSGDATLQGDYDAYTHQYITDWKGLCVDYGPVHGGASPDTAHAHFNAATKKVTGGWTFEAAIGWQALYPGGNNKFAAQTNLALDFEVNDGDGTQQVAALVLTMAPAASSCTCTQANCCCGSTPDVPSCDSQRITRVVLQ